MTEEEAKQKWCPHVRFGEEAVNRGEGDMMTPNPRCKSVWNNCIASDCMMWKSTVTREDARAMNAASNAHAEPQGHCGLTK